MDRFENLERTWEARRRKYRIAYLIATPLLLGSAAGLYYFSQEPAPAAQAARSVQEAPAKTPEPAVLVEAAKPQAPVAAVQAPIQTPAAPVKAEPKPLPPSNMTATVMDKEPLPDTEPPTIVLDRSFEQEIPERLAHMNPQEEEALQSPDESETQMVEISTEEISGSEQEQILLENFLTDPSYAAAVRVARLYYEQQHYEKAREWALKANELDKADDESWFLFASAALKLGEAEQAKKALETYLLKRDSLRIRELYQSIR